jgi:hypothetical protein
MPRNWNTFMREFEPIHRVYSTESSYLTQGLPSLRVLIEATQTQLPLTDWNSY